MQDNREKRSKLAKDVLRLCRNQILVNLRFMDAALSRLTEAEIEGVTLATDGKYLAYDARHILRCYKEDRAHPVRDYLHAVMHCVFRHNFVHTLTDQKAWDLACDIAVEHSITQLGLRAAQSARETRQAKAIQTLQKGMIYFTEVSVPSRKNHLPTTQRSCSCRKNSTIQTSPVGDQTDIEKRRYLGGLHHEHD